MTTIVSWGGDPSRREVIGWMGRPEPRVRGAALRAAAEMLSFSRTADDVAQVERVIPQLQWALSSDAVTVRAFNNVVLRVGGTPAVVEMLASVAQSKDAGREEAYKLLSDLGTPEARAVLDRMPRPPLNQRDLEAANAREDAERRSAAVRLSYDLPRLKAMIGSATPAERATAADGLARVDLESLRQRAQDHESVRDDLLDALNASSGRDDPRLRAAAGVMICSAGRESLENLTAQAVGGHDDQRAAARRKLEYAGVADQYPPLAAMLRGGGASAGGGGRRVYDSGRPLFSEDVRRGVLRAWMLRRVMATASDAALRRLAADELLHETAAARGPATRDAIDRIRSVGSGRAAVDFEQLGRVPPAAWSAVPPLPDRPPGSEPANPAPSASARSGVSSTVAALSACAIVIAATVATAMLCVVTLRRPRTVASANEGGAGQS